MWKEFHSTKVRTFTVKKQDLLVVSSQGNNSYLLYQASAPYTQVGRFRIGVNLNGMENGRETQHRRQRRNRWASRHAFARR
ncbi:hypothetical protein ACRN94_17670 [Shewanella baltica]|uniref:hypothetical protein n=1 Tax=Shewanella baltica TaxID=62322 RepID=UPI003D7A0175